MAPHPTAVPAAPDSPEVERLGDACRFAVRAYIDGGIAIEGIRPAIEYFLVAGADAPAVPTLMRSLFELRCAIFMMVLFSQATTSTTTAAALVEGFRFRDEQTQRAGPTPEEFDELFRFSRAVMNDDAELQAWLNMALDASTLSDSSERSLLRRRGAGQITVDTVDAEMARARRIEVSFREAAARVIIE
jgi:hypothetical protein